MNNAQLIDEIMINLGREVELASASLRFEVRLAVEAAISQLESGNFLPDFMEENLQDPAIENVISATGIGKFNSPLPRRFVKGAENKAMFLQDPDTGNYTMPKKVWPEELSRMLRVENTSTPQYYTVAVRTPEAEDPAPGPAADITLACFVEERNIAGAFEQTFILEGNNSTMFFRLSSVITEPVKLSITIGVDTFETPWIGDNSFQAALDSALSGTGVATGIIQDPNGDEVLQDIYSMDAFDLGGSTIIATLGVVNVGSPITVTLYNPLLKEIAFASTECGV